MPEIQLPPGYDSDRTESGHRLRFLKPEPPDPEVIAEARANAYDHPTHAACACCASLFNSDAQRGHIMANGVCGMCLQYIRGFREYIVITEPPTLWEVLVLYLRGVALRPVEANVLGLFVMGRERLSMEVLKGVCIEANLGNIGKEVCHEERDDSS